MAFLPREQPVQRVSLLTSAARFIFALVAAVVVLVIASNRGHNTNSALSKQRLPEPKSSYCQADMISPRDYAPPRTPATLEQIQVVVRHGDRVPCNVLPNEQTTWDCDGPETLSVSRIATQTSYVNDFPVKMNLWNVRSTSSNVICAIALDREHVRWGN
eukprot:c9649_g1_i4.p1 GENE.c9649_g1_i4~~c9649_g1_i4.p1  ORF type:complete len:169 (-),score=31.54 c9649_g1_i4:213-689(-)